MAQKTNSFERFWKELKRRKVVHVITVYVAIAFGILQLVDIIGPSLQWPDWTITFIIVLLCIGFIIAVFVSWIYDITPAGVKKTKPASAVKHIDQITTPISNGWKIATYASGVIIIALLTFNFISRKNLNADISKLEKSIAVLPFKLLSDEPDKQYLADGMMDAITLHLSKIKDLRVMSRTSVEQYRGTTKTTRQIGKELDVEYLLEGSFQKFGDNARLIVQLIKASEESHAWGNEYNNKWSDVFLLQGEVAQEIASELDIVISPEIKQFINKAPTSNLTAYDFYLRGREEFVKYWRYNNREALSRAEVYYRRALEYDPKYAEAYTGLAMIYWNKNIFREYFSMNFLDSVRILSDIALSFDNKVSEAYVLKGDYYRDKGNGQRALEEYDKALKINPNSWESYRGKAFLYINNDIISSIDNYQKAALLVHGPERQVILSELSIIFTSGGFIELANKCCLESLKLYGDSLSYLISLGYIENALGNYSKSNEYFEKVYALDSAGMVLPMFNMNTLLFLGNNNMFLDHFEESLKYYKKLITQLEARGEINYNSMHRIGYTFWENGYRKEADFYFNLQMEYCNNLIKSDRPHAQNYYAYYDRAGVYAFRGDKEKAYEDLKVFNQKQGERLWMVTLIKDDPLFDRVRNEPEFQQIVRDVEAKYQAEHERVRKWLEEQGML